MNDHPRAVPDDRPITAADIGGPERVLELLGDRLAQHLGSGWCLRSGAAVWLIGPEHEQLRLQLDARDGYRLLVSPVLPSGTVRDLVREYSLFLRPSQLAEQIRTAILAPYRRRLRSDRDKAAQAERERAARAGHASAVAERLGDDWTVSEDRHVVKAERARKRTRVHGTFGWAHDGHLYLHLHNVTPELIERVADAVVDHMGRHEIAGSPSLRKRPKRLTYLLELMVSAGYRIDQLRHEHEDLFGRPLFTMDLGTYPGMPLLDYLFERYDAIDRAISYLTKDRDAES